ncbi:MAG: rod shape-determining protein RodA [Marinilabiliaceae bacterium]|jgi:rod shape determining protein RodA|nr:rod shape-determining protein RodA [Bacteroidales bacterium]MCR5696220.1 rod shape-determining protein RodA [Marinilabiliaceae bacterium]
MLGNNPYRKGIDWWMVLLYVALVGFGWANLYAANFNPETGVFFSVDAEYFKQLVWIGISIISVSIIMILDAKLYVEISTFVYIISIILLLVVLAVGKEVHGAKAWFELGPIRFQPVEFTKLGTALLIARFMSRYNFQFTTANALKIGGILLLPIALVLLQNDTGSALIFFTFLLPMFREGMSPHILLLGVVAAATAIASLLIGDEWVMAIVLLVSAMVITVKFQNNNQHNFGIFAVLIGIGASAMTWGITLLLHKHVELSVLFLIGAGVTTMFVLIRMVTRRFYRIFMVLVYMWAGLAMSFGTSFVFENVLIEHQRTRINILFGKEDDPLGAGYNVNQSLIAIGSGGFSGKGYLQGTQTKFNFVPKQSTDFIFCTVGEEWGFMGSFVLIGLYLLFFMRLISLAEKQHSAFSRVYGYCVASIFFFHFAVNISMTIGLMPVIGIPLPFFSYGGSSLWGFSILLFIFLKLDTNRNELIR